MKRYQFDRGFTLVELLTVIAIIAVLSGLVVGLVGRVRESSRLAQGLDNLRQIGVAIRLYAADNRNTLPVAYRQKSPSTDFSATLSGVLDGFGMNYGERAGKQKSLVFRDPALADSTGTLHYSAHPLLMTSAHEPTPVSLATISDQARLVILMDGTLNTSGNANATASKVPGITTRQSDFGSDLLAAVPANPDQTNADSGQIRWSAKDDTAAKFLFVDGHVALLSVGELKYRNIIAE